MKKRNVIQLYWGDWNSKLRKGGQKNENVGSRGKGKKNKNGEKLVEFVYMNNGKIANTFF